MFRRDADAQSAYLQLGVLQGQDGPEQSEALCSGGSVETGLGSAALWGVTVDLREAADGPGGTYWVERYGRRRARLFSLSEGHPREGKV